MAFFGDFQPLGVTVGSAGAATALASLAGAESAVVKVRVEAAALRARIAASRMTAGSRIVSRSIVG